MASILAFLIPSVGRIHGACKYTVLLVLFYFFISSFGLPTPAVLLNVFFPPFSYSAVVMPTSVPLSRSGSSCILSFVFTT